MPRARSLGLAAHGPRRRRWCRLGSSLSDGQRSVLGRFARQLGRRCPPERIRERCPGVADRWVNMSDFEARAGAIAVRRRWRDLFRRATRADSASAGTNSVACRPMKQRRIRDNYERYREMDRPTAGADAQRPLSMTPERLSKRARDFATQHDAPAARRDRKCATVRAQRKKTD